MLKNIIYIILFWGIGSFYAVAQTVEQPTPPERKVVQITGVVIEVDSSAGIPFTNIKVKGTGRGTVSDYYGFFTLVVREGDTLVFSNVGYSPVVSFLPKKMETDNYYMLAKLQKDTIMLKTVSIAPYNAKTFGEAFKNLKLEDEEYDRAMKNLSRQELETIRMGTPIDGGVAFKGAMQQRSTALYTAGGLPSPSILNPFAWAQFFKALKQGKFKDPYKDNKK